MESKSWESNPGKSSKIMKSKHSVESLTDRASTRHGESCARLATLLESSVRQAGMHKFKFPTSTITGGWHLDLSVSPADCCSLPACFGRELQDQVDSRRRMRSSLEQILRSHLWSGRYSPNSMLYSHEASHITILDHIFETNSKTISETISKTSQLVNESSRPIYGWDMNLMWFAV